MAGAFYGLDAIDPAWRRDLGRWDAGEIELRAVCLFLTPTLSDLPYPADSTSASSNFCDSTDSCLPCVTM